MTGVERWIEHSPMSDPSDFASTLARLPSDIDAINRTIQGLLIHTDWLTAYGVDEKSFGAVSRQTLPVATRLAAILKRDARPLDIPRLPDQRAVGTCRDFALLLCSILRSKGIPARVRCGFAGYFHSDWEDHWVCEYWDRSAGIWRLSDPQMDQLIAMKCNASFNPPRQSFITACFAWLDCRSGRSDPNRFGHGQTKGLWFLKVNVIRDHYAINNQEVSAWDEWRAAPESARVVDDREASLLDSLANFPERKFAGITPDWQADESACPEPRRSSGNTVVIPLRVELPEHAARRR
jgi:hypothetical protein